MNKIFMVFALIVIVLFLFGCTQQQDKQGTGNGDAMTENGPSNEELESDLNGIGEDLGIEDFEELNQELDELDSLDYQCY